MLYHAFLRTEKETLYWANLSKEIVIEKISGPYSRHEPFFFYNKLVEATKVTEIWFFGSSVSFEKLRLPNGKNPVDEKNPDYIIEAISTGKVKGIWLCPHELIELGEQKQPVKGKSSSFKNNTKVFIVHGRDDRDALALQKYLKDVYYLNVIIFDDFKRRTTGTTVIEALEEIKDSIGYTFIIAAPEDLGQWREEVNEWCKDNLMCNSSVEAQKVNQFINSMLNTRARQNVVFEYGLFMGALGRDRVCCLLKSGTKEKPSDISGVLYEEFKHSISEKFADIVEKLKNPEIGLIK